jgi:hypothetical protein
VRAGEHGQQWPVEPLRHRIGARHVAKDDQAWSLVVEQAWHARDPQVRGDKEAERVVSHEPAGGFDLAYRELRFDLHEQTTSGGEPRAIHVAAVLIAAGEGWTPHGVAVPTAWPDGPPSVTTTTAYWSGRCRRETTRPPRWGASAHAS